MSNLPRLVAIPYSPWSEKARWALDAQGVSYTYRAYTPMLGELGLRLKLRKLRGRVTVPVLLDHDGIHADSFAIAVYAAQKTEGQPLITPDTLQAIEAWNATSERMLEAGRVRTTRRVLENDDALRESLPRPLSKLGPISKSVARSGAKFLLRKYPSQGDLLESLRQACQTLQTALAGKDHLLGDTLSYADIVMAVSLQFILPVDSRYIRLGERSRLCWTEPELAETFHELLGWRDNLYDKFRVQ